MYFACFVLCVYVLWSVCWTWSWPSNEIEEFVFVYTGTLYICDQMVAIYSLTDDLKSM
jgi:hypothetical protein